MVPVNLDVTLLFYDWFWLVSLVRGVAMSQKKICLPFLMELHRLKFIHGRCFTVQYIMQEVPHKHPLLSEMKVSTQ